VLQKVFTSSRLSPSNVANELTSRVGRVGELASAERRRVHAIQG
jgi:hypothetical protein